MQVDSRPTPQLIGKMSDIEEINMAMTQVFQEAQISLSSHRKLVVILTNLHKKAIDMGYEEAFSFKFTKLVNKILPLKKGDEFGDRIIKFCSVFIANLFKIEQKRMEGMDDEDMEDEEGSITTRIANYLLNHLLRGVEAKDRNVRYRIIQLIAYMVNFIGDIDATVFTSLVHSLKKRLADKEQTVRLQAVVALSRFQNVEEEDIVAGEDTNINPFSKSLIEVMQNDDSPEVRRAALLNLAKNTDTLPFLIERARDVNTINRRIVYSRVLKEFGDFREIDVDSRNLLVQWGLNDRELTVKNAALRLFNNYWFESVNKDFLLLLDNLYLFDEDDSVDKLLKHLFEMNLDTVRNLKFDKTYWREFSVEKSFLLRNLFEFLTENKYYNLIDEKFVDLIELSDILYKYLKLRKARLLKNKSVIDAYNEFKRLIETKDLDSQAVNSEIQRSENDLIQYEKMAEMAEQLAEQAEQMSEHSTDEMTQRTAEATGKIAANRGQIMEKLRMKIDDLVSKQAQILQEKELIIEANQEVREDYSDFKEEYNELEFIIENLLKISKDYDYADEAGRRSMLQIIRTSLTNDKLSEKLMGITLKVLRILSINERDFIGMGAEIITDIRDSTLDENDETFHSAVSGFLGPGDSDDEDGDEEDEPNSQAIESQDGKEGESNADYTNNLNRIGNVFEDQNYNGSYVTNQKRAKRRKLEPRLPPKEIWNQCLSLTIHLLELVSGPVSNTTNLQSIFDGLMTAAVTLMDGSLTNKLGCRCQGLLMLVDKDAAIEHLYSFGRIVSLNNFDEDFKIISIKVIIDVLSIHGLEVLDKVPEMSEIDDNNDNQLPLRKYVDSFSLNKLFIKCLKDYRMAELQAVTAEGLCKLYLADILETFGSGFFDDSETNHDQFEDLLEVLILSYFDVKNHFNNKLRQVLSFCIPVYCFSHSKHQIKLAKIAGNVIYKFSKRQLDYEDDYKGNEPALAILHSVTATSVLQQLIHWCDPNNLVKKEQHTSESPIWEIISLLQAAEQDTPKAVKKAIINNFNKIYLSETLSFKMVSSLNEALEETNHVFEQRSEDPEFMFDSLTRKNFNKFRDIVREIVERKEREDEEQEPEEGQGEQPEEEAEEVMELDAKDQTPPPFETIKKESDEENQDQQQELDDIDNFLDEEDKVEYDI